jgi:predicted metal-dependent hydrolase
MTTVLELEVLSVELGDRVVEVEVRRSDRARTTRIQLGRDVPLRIIVPSGASNEYAAQALRNKASWVLGRLRQVEEARQYEPELDLADPAKVWVHGASFDIVESEVRYAQLQDGRLLVPGGDAEGSTRRWYRRAAGKALRKLVVEEAERLGVTVASVGIRDQRTRWGSCSRGGHISLNWRLLIVPEDVARYVVVHELVHLHVPNHSKAFWRALGATLPDWRAASEWLARHGDELRRYEPNSRTR